VGRAQERGLIRILVHQIRDYAFDRHQITDDLPYGGGQGMIMKPDPIFRAVRAVTKGAGEVPILLLSPQGRQFTQAMAGDLAQAQRIAMICGHYEGVDERVREHLAVAEVSIGDYVLTGGELAAMVIVDAVVRLVPGVLGATESAADDSFASGLLEGPQYTRPATFEGWAVPEVLRSGNHAAIARWQRTMALKRTAERRPDLLSQAPLSDEDRRILAAIERSSDEPDEA